MFESIHHILILNCFKFDEATEVDLIVLPFNLALDIWPVYLFENIEKQFHQDGRFITVNGIDQEQQ
jgi:hypothetical protein